MTARLAVMLSFVLLSAACAPTVCRPYGGFADRPSQTYPVHHLWSDGIQGSAVHVKPGVLLTAAHLLRSPVLKIDGVVTGYRVLAASAPHLNGRHWSEGEQLPSEDDWALIQVNLDLRSVPAELSFDPVSDGSEVTLVGFPGGKEQILRARQRSVPCWWPLTTAGERSRLTYLKARKNSPSPGLSGGGCFQGGRLIGIYVEYDQCGLSSRQVVRNIPACLKSL